MKQTHFFLIAPHHQHKEKNRTKQYVRQLIIMVLKRMSCKKTKTHAGLVSAAWTDPDNNVDPRDICPFRRLWQAGDLNMTAGNIFQGTFVFMEKMVVV